MSKQANYYADILKAWPKGSGTKPTHDLLLTAQGLGCRAGVQALFIAMCLREKGSTVQQFMMAGSSGPANNKRRELVTHKLVKLTVEGKPYAYCLTLTEKGKAKADAYKAALAAGEITENGAAVKPAAKVKAKGKTKAKAAKPETVVEQQPDVQAAETQADAEIAAVERQTYGVQA